MFIVYIIFAIICGCITSSMNKSKGYDGGFWWGFILGIIGIIVIAVRPYAVQSSSQDSNLTQSAQNTSNTVYNTSNLQEHDLKSELLSLKMKGVLTEEEYQQKLATLMSKSESDIIEKLKSLRDSGIISEEEFQEKVLKLDTNNG